MKDLSQVTDLLLAYNPLRYYKHSSKIWNAIKQQFVFSYYQSFDDRLEKTSGKWKTNTHIPIQKCILEKTICRSGFNLICPYLLVVLVSPTSESIVSSSSVGLAHRDTRKSPGSRQVWVEISTLKYRLPTLQLCTCLSRPFCDIIGGAAQVYKGNPVARVEGRQLRIGYFILDFDSGILQYYVTEASKNQKPRGFLSLAGSVISLSEEAPNMIIVYSTNGEVYKLRAADAKERQVWMTQLQACAKYHSESKSAVSQRARSYSLLPHGTSNSPSPANQRQQVTHTGPSIVTVTHHKSPAAARRSKNQNPAQLHEVKEVWAQITAERGGEEGEGEEQTEHAQGHALEV
ncbi:hypothetical protein XELAEV_18031084mg [Xenopus laevis]|uniref:PH domain-containing protein n=1 Tax=Xenopus laevis TaxID=8355 RepID=A0A974CMQ3_XENLA|nr:hypothetical protein XELAEV_18031084mg [Xenopus laevis]